MRGEFFLMFVARFLVACGLLITTLGGVLAQTNLPPTITSSNTVSVTENQTSVIKVTAIDDKDREGFGLSFSNSGGVDGALFNVNAVNGLLTFVNAPNFEKPADSDGDNVYHVQVTVFDSGGLSDVQDVVVTVTDNLERTWNLEGVTFSNGAVATGSFQYDTSTGTYSDFDILVSNSPGNGTNRYGVPNPSSRGTSTFLSAVVEVRADMTGVRSLVLTFASALTDQGGTIDIVPRPTGLSLQAVCRDANCRGPTGPVDSVNAGRVTTELPPTITSADTVSVTENQTSVIKVTAIDDKDREGFGLSFSNSGGVDGVLFNVNAVNGLLTFVNAPDFEKPADADGDNVYNVQVTVTDSGGRSDVQDVVVTVTDNLERTWNLEDVTFSNGATATGSFMFDASTGTYSDFDILVSNSPGNGTNRYGVPNPRSRGTSTFLSAVVEVRADMTGVRSLVFQFASALTDQDGTIDIVPRPLGLSLQAVCKDALCRGPAAPVDSVSGGRVTTELAPTITSSNTVSVPENQTGVLDVQATDDKDAEGSGLSFSKSGGADEALFNVDATNGIISFANTPDFENPADADGDNVYNVQVTVTDSGGRSDVQDVVVTVTNINEAPLATDDTFELTQGTPLVTLAPGLLGNDQDVDANTMLTAIAVSQPSSGTLSLNPDGSFNYTPRLNFFGTDSFTYVANDGSLDSNIATVTLTVKEIEDQCYVIKAQNGNTVVFCF